MESRPFDIRFRLGPVPVAIEPSFWLAALMLGLLMAPSRGEGVSAAAGLGAVVGAVLASLLIHELGHALACRLMGSPASVRLYAFGGLTVPERRLSRGGELLFWIAGPGAGLIFGSLALALAHLHPSASPSALFALKQLAYINLGWSLANLLPVLPLDAGQALFALVGQERPRLALALSAGFAFAVAAALGLFGQIFGAGLFVLLAMRNLQARAAAGEALESAAALQEALGRGWRALRAGNEVEARRVANQVIEGAADPEARNLARDLLAWVSLAEASAPEALRHLERSEPPEAARPLTWALVLQKMGDRAGALPYALQAVEVEPSQTSAELALGLLLVAGRREEARALAERFAWPRTGGRDAALGEVWRAEGDFARAASHFESASAASGRPDDALRAAQCHARAGRADAALAWLERAAAAGLDDLEALAADPDLELVRSDPRLRALLGRQAAS